MLPSTFSQSTVHPLPNFNRCADFNEPAIKAYSLFLATFDVKNVNPSASQIKGLPPRRSNFLSVGCGDVMTRYVSH